MQGLLVVDNKITEADLECLRDYARRVVINKEELGAMDEAISVALLRRFANEMHEGECSKAEIVKAIYRNMLRPRRERQRCGCPSCESRLRDDLK